MLVILACDSREGGSRHGTALRDRLGEPGAPAAWIDGVGLTERRPPDPSGADTFARSRDALEAAIDPLEASGIRRHVVGVGAALAARAAELAFFLKRREAQRCFLLGAGGPPEEWAAGAAEIIRRPDSPVLLTPWEPQKPWIETERLVLTFATREQIGGYFSSIVGSAIFDMLVWDGPKTESELHDWALKSRRGYAKGKAHPVGFAVIEASTGRQIGLIGGGPAPKDTGRWAIGYSLALDAHGKGYGTESVGALVDYLFRDRGAARIDAEVYTVNPASRRLLEKLGFSLEGTLIQAQAKAGGRRDLWIFGITRDVWSRRRS